MSQDSPTNLEYNTHKHNGLDGTTPIKHGEFVPVSIVGTAAATAANYGVFFIARQPCVVVDVYESHTVAGTNGSAVTLQIERLQTGEALDAGDALLATAFNLKSTANTPVRGTITKTGRTMSLKAGDRLALKDSGTLTDVAGVCVVVTIEYIYA